MLVGKGGRGELGRMEVTDVGGESREFWLVGPGEVVHFDDWVRKWSFCGHGSNLGFGIREEVTDQRSKQKLENIQLDVVLIVQLVLLTG